MDVRIVESSIEITDSRMEGVDEGAPLSDTFISCFNTRLAEAVRSQLPPTRSDGIFEYFGEYSVDAYVPPLEDLLAAATAIPDASREAPGSETLRVREPK